MSTKSVPTAFDGIVVGGGPAGMFAAIAAGERGQRVLLLERNGRLGRKLLITGKGRCNLTNNCSAREVLENVPRNPRFLHSALAACPPERVMAFFEANGCPVKTERGGRVFPVSDRSASVLAALETALRRGGVRVEQGRVEEILTENGAVRGVRTEREAYSARWVILATGGLSYPATGSTGDGYALAAALGHTVVPGQGSLVPLETEGPDCPEMQGLSLKNVAVKLKDSRGKVLYEDFGELLFTHFGVSGPTVLSASAHLTGKCTLFIDLKPALTPEKLDARLLRELGAFPNRSLAHILSALLPRSMIPVFLRRLSLDGERGANALTRRDRQALCALLKAFPVVITGRRPVAEAIVTSGGVAVSEIDPRTMASKKIPGLYFAGEIIDCDAYTGGFNLQIAWATGFAAGRAAGEKTEIDKRQDLY